MAQLEIKGLNETRADFSHLRRVLQAYPIVGKVAADARNLISQRNLHGFDQEYREFTEYSEKPIYMDKKRRPVPKGGRRRHQKTQKALKTVFYAKGYQEYAAATKGHSRPNLFASGAMMRSFQAQTRSATRAQIGFTQRLQALKALGNQAKRKFAAINVEREMPRLQATFEQEIDKVLRKSGF